VTVDLIESPGFREVGPLALVLELKNIAKSLSGTRVLDGASMSLEAGMIHAIVGPGGSGKTLLLKTISTLLVPDEGSLSLFGQEVNLRDVEALRGIRARIGMQFQNLALFDFLSVRDNVAFPLHRTNPPLSAADIQQRVLDALEAVHLGGTADMDVQELSGGMQRRVAIARAAVAQADLLIFDDPGGGLDPVTSSRIFDRIADIQATRGCTVIIASHDMDRLAPICGCFHVVIRGRVAFSGTLEEGRNGPDHEARTYLDVDDDNQ
jgi:phospholipid/cholesterol/gamma-HCH transport system ATP-binding protein